MRTATYIRQLSDWMGDARLYLLGEPVSYSYWTPDDDFDRASTHYVVVSGVDHEYACETYIFPADAAGAVLNWGELSGSFRGSVDHERALEAAGYSVN